MAADDTAFIRRICEDPADDLPRLILADWLDEHGRTEPCPCCGSGRPREWVYATDKDGNCERCRGAGWVPDATLWRAEFIRVQCEIARWPCECNSEERVYYDECRCGELYALRRRERELLNENRGRWWNTYRVLSADGRPPVECLTERVIDIEFRCGFVEVIHCAWPDFARHQAALRAATPLREVVLTTEPPPADLRRYEFTITSAEIGRPRLWRSPCFPGLTFRMRPESSQAAASPTNPFSPRQPRASGPPARRAPGTVTRR